MDDLRILVSTDTHLGYAEREPLRADDAFRTFEEVLRTAHDVGADALLLGGDLFHDNRPSRATLHRCVELLRQYCMGSRPVALEMLSEPSAVLAGAFGTANWEDPNYNVGLPVLAIHGNHDDPAGEGGLSALDVLAAAGLINYFGKTPSVDDIRLAPVVLRKGNTRLALYGLGAVRDERLHRAFLRGRVRLLRVPEDDAPPPVSLLVLHQNRAAHGPTGYIPEAFLRGAGLDAVIWGHEHECLVCAETGRWDSASPAPTDAPGLRVIQPGSSVATSLSPGEVPKKHAVLITISGSSIADVTPIALKSVRPMAIRDVSLRGLDVRDPRSPRAVEAALVAAVEALIAQAVASAAPGAPLPPLVRLRVDVSPDEAGPEFALPNAQRFGLAFSGRVANPRDILHIVTRRGKKLQNQAGSAVQPQQHADGQSGAVHVEDVLSQLLACAPGAVLLPQNEFCDTLRGAVARDDREALASFVRAAVERASGAASAGGVLDREAVVRAFGRVRAAREEQWRRLHTAEGAAGSELPRPDLAGGESSAPNQSAGATSSLTDLAGGESSNPTLIDVEPHPLNAAQSNASVPAARPTRGRGRGRGATRAPARHAAAGAKHAAQDDALLLMDDGDHSDAENVPQPKRRTIV